VELVPKSALLSAMLLLSVLLGSLSADSEMLNRGLEHVIPGQGENRDFGTPRKNWHRRKMRYFTHRARSLCQVMVLKLGQSKLKTPRNAGANRI
jgi:hypothetical protein